MPTAVLRSLHIHPVKSLGGVAPERIRVEPWGPAGDRRWMLIDAGAKVVTQRQHPRLALASARPAEDGGIVLSAPGRDPLTVAVPEPAGTLPAVLFTTKVEVVPAGEAADDWLSEFTGEPVRLVHLDDPAHRRPIDPEYARPGETVSLADGYPLLVTTTASLDALNALIAAGDHPEEGPLPMDRFRPNAVIDGTGAWEEDGWSRIAVGGVVLRVAKPCARCVVTTTDQRTAARGKEPLRTLARHRLIGKKMIFGQNLVPETTGTLRVGDSVEILA
ncbi:MOSC domain-containing protein [Streptomyces sp. LP05-1]|uniref:MOSC domain-containing protein n=1 Tax=Streptomyces pyxinae TaxID=2970734 RepID=A0ABT2CHX7_9ACTN|nr:MOSC N-terminal beta barrel domain-containing protein [Streptomyces sp. LP05-1]MCS0637016.1 MOSC domain-containing protein [Streptomyces sp. LP05-1]